MDEQRAWLRAKRKRRLRILAVILCVCVLFTTYPDILAVISVFASEVSEQPEGRYISGFTALSDEIREQAVPVGTALTELLLPDTLEAVITEEKQPSEDTEDKSEESGREDAGENDGEETDGDTTGTEDMDGSAEETEEDKPSDTEQEDTETGGETEDNDTETGDGQDTQPEEDGESGETDGSTETGSDDAADTENEEGSEGSASSEEQQESAVSQETHTVTMQEYLAENVIPVQTLENTQTEKQEEIVTIDSVTWQSEPEYDGSAEGTYTFTAVLPDDYALADGVSLPQITVTVESGTDAMIQVLLDRIAALPGAEEYLALEPDMEENEEAYVEWEEKLYEYAEEALAIWEEYEALTEEQQAMIAEEELAKLTAWVELAETFSDHAVMLADYSEHHGESDWTALTASDTTLSGGKYYLSSDITMGTITVTGNVTLCLNGHTLTHDDSTDGSVIVVESGEFTLCDCQDHWGYTSSFDEGTKTYTCGVTGTGGRITGSSGNNFKGGGVYVSSGATFNMNSGRITGCDVGTVANHDGGGVAVIGGTFNMSGGYIDGNKASCGGGVYLTDQATFKMSGNAVIMNNGSTNGGGVYCYNGVNVKFTMDSGAIIGNKTSINGGGVFLGQSSTFNMNGGTIEGNCTTATGSFNPAGIYAMNATINLAGDCSIRYNKAGAGVGGIVALLTSTISVSGNICIADNYGNGDGTESNVLLANLPITVTDELTNNIGVTFKPLSGNVNYPVAVANGTASYQISDIDWSYFSSDNEELKIIKDENALFLDLPGTCDLSGLDLTAEGAKLEPNFQADITTYTATVGNEVDTVGITATLAGTTDGKTIKIKNGTDLPETDMTSGEKEEVPLAVGLNTIEITVTSGSETKTYTIEITREAPAGNPVTITSYKDGVAWTGAGAPSDSDYKLTSDGGNTFLPGLAAPDGTYKIYSGDTDTGVEVTVTGAEVTARVDYYTVTFYDGSTALTTPAQQIVLKNQTASAPATDPTKTGYTFGKWVTADGGSTAYDFTKAVTGKTSVYASWTPVSYSITYILDGGTVAGNPAGYTIESGAITLKNPTRTGYSFTGWSGTDLTGNNNTGVIIEAGSTGDREYTAHWSAADYTVTLHTNGGTGGTDLTSYTYGTGAALPTDWTKTGYTFDGWYDNERFTGTAITDISDSDTGDKEYWAKWTANTYQATFDYHGADGGNTTQSKDVTYDSTYGALPVPSRTGYTFKGWYTEENGQGSKVDAGTTVTTTSAHTLHAYWKDETAPNQPVLQDGVTLPAGWTNTQDAIPLKLYDGVGVTELWVSVDGKDYIKVDGFSGGTGSVNYNYAVLDGEHTYQFKAVDATDNVSEESDVFTVKLDQTKPVIGTITYENKAADLWQWIIGKTSMIVHVPVTDTGSSVAKISYTLTPRDAAGNLDSSNAVEKTAAVKDGEAKLTFDADFQGTITINCMDAAGNAADGVIIGKDAGGVIVEDHAPDITTDAKTDYYDTAAAINVTVKDDTGNAITAGIASVTYQVGDGTERSVSVNTSALQAEVTFTIPASEIPTGITEIKITAKDNAGNETAKSITIKVKGPEKQPAAEIDYREEELTGLVPNGVYSIDGTEYTADQQGHIPIIEGWFGNTVNIIKKGNGNETTDSPAQSLPIPARPAAPDAPELSARTDNSITLKNITGAQYRLEDGTGNWQDSTAFTGLAQKTIYQFRAYYPATDTSFASAESGTAQIATMPTAPTKDKVKIGYTAETLTLTDGIEAFSDAGCTTPVTVGSVEAYMGQTVYIRYPAKGIIPASLTTAVSIPARPAKPAPGQADASYPGAKDGAITGLTFGTAYEYRVKDQNGNFGAWKDASLNGTRIGNLPAGEYEVRVKAVETGNVSFRSEAAAVTIGEKPGVKVTFVVDGEEYATRFTGNGGNLTGIPPVPAKENAVGAWCMDEQGTTPAGFTNITADMTVYAVYTTAYTVTLQGGTGYTLSAESGSTSPVKEGGSFTFRFALANGYQKTADFAVKVNGVKAELTAQEPYTYTITDIRENKTVTVEGVAKKPGGKPSNSDGGDKEDEPEPPPSSEPSDGTPPTAPVKPLAEVTPPAPGTKPPPSEKEPEGRKPQTIPEQEESGEPEKGQGPEGIGPQEPETDSADAGQTEKEPQAEKKEVQIGNGTVIVTVVCEEEKCTAAVADTEAVVKAVLTPDQQALVYGGETIEIRIDVTDISGQVPEQDKEVIENGIEAYREEVPGLVLGMYVDISMFIRIGARDWNTITATDEPIEVVVGIPEKLQSDGRKFIIIRAHEGEYTFMNDLDDTPDTITVSTDLFSSYAIAYVETEGAEGDDEAKCGLCHICPTFLGICYFIWLAVIIAVIVIVILLVLHRKKEDEPEEKR